MPWTGWLAMAVTNLVSAALLLAKWCIWQTKFATRYTSPGSGYLWIKNVSESLSFFFEVTSSREVPGDVGLPVLFNQVWKVGVGAVGECR